ncbi:MAG: hypothetical protein ABSG26_14965 [Bryobacteraceae bacterium]|jgi:hypothetical protein
MQLSDFVGQPISMLIPFIHQTALQKVNLLGVEAGGVWIESQTFTNAVLQKLGVPTSPKTSVLFVPYHGIGLGLFSIDQPALDEKAFGV